MSSTDRYEGFDPKSFDAVVLKDFAELASSVRKAASRKAASEDRQDHLILPLSHHAAFVKLVELSQQRMEQTE